MDVLYTDFSKAFNRVSHELLIFKLRRLGFPENLLPSSFNYLTGRTQRVLFNFIFSREIRERHLGPMLFNLYINDLPSCVHCPKVLL